MKKIFNRVLKFYFYKKKVRCLSELLSLTEQFKKTIDFLTSNRVVVRDFDYKTAICWSVAQSSISEVDIEVCFFSSQTVNRFIPNHILTKNFIKHKTVFLSNAQI